MLNASGSQHQFPMYASLLRHASSKRLAVQDCAVVLGLAAEMVRERTACILRRTFTALISKTEQQCASCLQCSIVHVSAAVQSGQEIVSGCLSACFAQHNFKSDTRCRLVNDAGSTCSIKQFCAADAQ